MSSENIEMTDVSSNEMIDQFHIPILEVIKTAQQQNGLRHGDYQRYRQYCARKLRRIRKSVKFTYGKGKQFINKKVSIDNAESMRHLLIPLFNAERAWSYAMRLREDEKNDKDEKGDDYNSRIKFHLLSRLLKAAKWSDELRQICSSKADARTCLEAEAYCAYMAGNLLLYREVWDGALREFSKAKRVYTELAKVGTLEQQDLMTQVLDEISPYMRYCEYNLNVLGKDVDLTNDETLMSLRERAGSLIQSKLDAVFKETAVKQAQSMGDILWSGKPLALNTDELRVMISQVNEQVVKLNGMKENNSKKEQLYTSIFTSFDGALRKLNVDREKLNQMKSGQLVDAQKEELERVKQYLTFSKLSCLISRNQILFLQLQQRLKTKHEDESNQLQPEDIIHILDMLVQNVEELQTIPGCMEDQKQNAKCSALFSIFSAYRCYYIASSFLSKKKFSEASALFERSTSLMNKADEMNQQNGILSEENEHMINDLKKELQGIRIRTLAQAFLETSKTQKDLSQGLKKLSVSTPSKANDRNKNLLERQNTFSSGDKQNMFDLIQIPPDMQSVPCKPLLFDIAYNHIEFPDIKQRTMTEEQKQKKQEDDSKKPSSSSSGFFGWLRG